MMYIPVLCSNEVTLSAELSVLLNAAKATRKEAKLWAHLFNLAKVPQLVSFYTAYVWKR